MIIWFTGLSGSGKTTLCNQIQPQIPASIILDGDVIRSLFKHTNFSIEGRKEHINIVGKTAIILEASGLVPIVSLMSPYQAQRDYFRNLSNKFIEIWISTPISECVKRDPKGIYKNFKHNLTGLNSIYEPPPKAELTLDTTNQSVRQCVEQIMEQYINGLKS